MQYTGRSLLFKTVLIGDSGVGKTNLLSRFADNEFNAESPTTIGVEFMTKALRIADVDLKAQIWDTAGQERFRAISRTMYHGSKGAMVVYDITCQESFDHVPAWLDELVAFTPSSAVIMLIGNKCDLELSRVVKKDVACKFAEERGLLFLETSALDCTNVDKAFRVLMTEILKVMQTPLLVTISTKGMLPAGKEVPNVVYLNSAPPPAAVTHRKRGPCCKS